MIDLQTLSAMIAATGVTIAAIYYIMILRNTIKTRQAQLLMGLYETYRSPEFRKRQQEIFNLEWTDFDDFWEKYGSEANPDVWATWLSVAGFFNGIGVLLRRRLIDIDLVGELLSNITFVSWAIMGPILIGWRESPLRYGEHTRSKKYDLIHGFEYLYNELRRRDEQHQ